MQRKDVLMLNLCSTHGVPHGVFSTNIPYGRSFYSKNLRSKGNEVFLFLLQIYKLFCILGSLFICVLHIFGCIFLDIVSTMLVLPRCTTSSSPCNVCTLKCSARVLSRVYLHVYFTLQYMYTNTRQRTCTIENRTHI
jgi:hypothetical protein